MPSGGQLRSLRCILERVCPGLQHNGLVGILRTQRFPSTPKQAAGVQYLIGNFRVLGQAAFDGCRNGLARFSAQTRLLKHQDSDAPQGAHNVGTGVDAESNPQLLFHAFLHMVQVAEAAQVFQSVQEALLVLAGQP